MTPNSTPPHTAAPDAASIDTAPPDTAPPQTIRTGSPLGKPSERLSSTGDIFPGDAPIIDPGEENSPNGRGRTAIVVTLVITLLLTGITREFASRQNMSRGALAGGQSSGATLGRMNSFALALLLGGLRGPLVMFLWPSAEAQKGAKDLQDLDTKIEWIRLLQAEFDSVHIFQIWNKAYNISVQMATLGNKYRTILDALDYARNVDRERPHNINIVYAIAGIYGEKLGGSAEKTYYRRRVREDSMRHASRQNAKRGDANWQRLEHDTLLDESGNVLPEFLKPALVKSLIDPTDANQTYDGSDLQSLPRWQPYPYGVSTSTIAFSYYKRAQLLYALAKQDHSQISDTVMDSRPALALKAWAEEECENGRRLEIEMLGKPMPDERLAMELPTANVAAEAFAPSRGIVPLGDKLARAIYNYEMCVRVAADADAEYVRHLKSFSSNFSLYDSHQKGLKALSLLAAADRDFLKSVAANTAPERTAMLAASADLYRRSITANQVFGLYFFLAAEQLAAVVPGKTKFDLDKLTPEQVEAVFEAVRKSAPPGDATGGFEVNEDFDEYVRYVERARQRLANMPK